MKIELEKKIADLITTYGETATMLNNDVKASVDKWKGIAIQNKIDPLKFKNSLYEEINTAREDAHNIAILLNQKLKLIVADAKQQMFPETATTDKRPADHAARVATALQFLSYEFDTLTDESVFPILKDFINDIDQMRLFKNVVEKYADMIDVNGNQRFPKTFGKLINVEVLLNTVNEIEQIAENMFLHPKTEGQAYHFSNMITITETGQGEERNSTPFYIALVEDGYEESADEAAILKLAKDVDMMASDLAGV